MIKFFRKIRQKLLSENKISKYLFYSIGEIILVVIGILIALQINNWNDAKKTDERQKKYLELVKTEMSNNLKILGDEKLKLVDLLNGLRELILLKDRSTSTVVSEKELSSQWAKVFSKSIIFKFENATLTEITSSGVLKEISNDTIRNLLTSWDGKIKKLVSQEGAINSYLQKGNDFIEKNGIVRLIIDNNDLNKRWQIEKLSSNLSNKFLLDSQEFENIIVFAIGTGLSLRDSNYETMKEEISSLIALIDGELY